MIPKTKISLLIAAMLCLCFLLYGCSSNVENQSHEELKHKSQEELKEGYYYYEGIFLPADKVIEVFKLVSDEYPRYSVVPDQFHVTTEYLPETTHEELYGTEVTVHITGYKYGTVIDPEDGSSSQNEGFKVEVLSEDSAMQEFLNSIDRNWHITGSYSTAARYTKYMDFSDAVPVDFTITGRFGRGDSDGNLQVD